MLKKPWTFHAGLVLVFVWCVPLPFFWAYNIAERFQQEYSRMLSFYTPELILAVLSAVFLSAAWSGRSWAVAGLLVSATLAPILKFSIGGPSFGTWAVTSLLLGLTAWRLHLLIKN